MDKDTPRSYLKRQSEVVKSQNESWSKKRKQEGDIDKNETACRNHHDTKKKVRLSTDLFHDHCEISYSQMHELLRYAALGKGKSASQPSWCQIRKQKNLSGVVVIVLKDVSQLHFYRFYLQFRFLRRMFRHRFSLPPPCQNVLASLLERNQTTGKEIGEKDTSASTPGVPLLDENVPMNPQNSNDLHVNPSIQKCGNKKYGLTRYLLSEEDMKKYDFPFLGSPDCVNYVSTECSSQVTDSSPLFGLDCEMCITENGKELTRISLVNADGHCVLDELVKPKNPIINYLTRFSGITRNILQPVKTRLQDIHAMVKDLLPPDAVLVGHSLNNDLQALQMIHPNVIDTSLLYLRENGGRFKLKFLAEAVLGQAIQCENQDGHDPAEDAKAALELAQYFIRNGPKKVAELNLQRCSKLPPKNGATLKVTKVVVRAPEKRGHANEPESHSSKTRLDHPSLFEIMHSNGQQCIFLSGTEGTTDLPTSSYSKPFLCASNKEILQQAKKEVPLSSLSVVQFSLGLENVGAVHMQSIYSQMRSQLAEMLTVYAGPFNFVFSMRTVKEEFESCGPIRSISVVMGTQQLFVCIQYELLEAAQLAVEILDGAHIEGGLIKVRRPIKETTLDFDTIIRELDGDFETDSIIYVSGIEKSETEEDLRQRFSHFKDLENIFLPKDYKSGKNRKYCFLKFHNYTSALIALTALNEPFDGHMKSRKALTPRHFHDWILHHHVDRGDDPVEENPGQDTNTLDQEVKEMMKKLDKTIKRLHKSFHNNTLCLVLLPGINRCLQEEQRPGNMEQTTSVIP
ncbi:RNA exonuclease 5 isoform X2 [Ambystoma mexicanum]|uniref:RNA exonuclease 5 isoform X2 n=1 Tax=Ambystoma mexicanum TaxID=8296 RepID=UPI0037E968A0